MGGVTPSYCASWAIAALVVVVASRPVGQVVRERYIRAGPDGTIVNSAKALMLATSHQSDRILLLRSQSWNNAISTERNRQWFFP